MIKLQQRKRQLDIFWLLMGGVASIVGLALLVPFADSLLWHEEKSWAFLVPAVLSLALGLGFGWLGRDHKRQIDVWEGALFMVLVWPLLSVLGMMPYVLSGVLTSPVDAFFESVAAITTTGLSCLDYARSDMARSLVLWHSIMNWLGGLNFIIILSTVLPQVSGCFGLTLSARQSIFFSPVWNKMAESARQGFGVYTALLAGLDPFAALTQSMVTLSSSGSADRGYFIAYDSIALELAAGISMLLSGLNPLLCWKVWDRLSFRLMLRDTELQAYAGLFLASGVLVAWNLCRSGVYDAAESLRYGLFQTAAFLSTGGFVSAPCWDWPDFSRLVLFVLVFVGGCIGSAGGGLKVMRLLVLMRMGVTEVRHTLHPHMVVSIKIDGLPVPMKIVGRILSFFFFHHHSVGQKLFAGFNPELAVDIGVVVFERIGSNGADFLNLLAGFAVKIQIEDIQLFSSEIRKAVLKMPIFFLVNLPVLRLNQTIDFLLQLFDFLLRFTVLLGKEVQKVIDFSHIDARSLEIALLNLLQTSQQRH